MTKKFHDTFSSFDRIPACDERTNIAYHRAVKVSINISLYIGHDTR